MNACLTRSTLSPLDSRRIQIAELGCHLKVADSGGINPHQLAAGCVGAAHPSASHRPIRARLSGRSPAALKKYLKRHLGLVSNDYLVNEEVERTPLTVTQVAEDLGVSRASVYRLLNKGVLRRFKGGIAGTSFSDLLREHPEAVPYSRLPRDHKEWLVLNGYFDASLSVKPPSTKGLLD